jgi:hypothetical protein
VNGYAYNRRHGKVTEPGRLEAVRDADRVILADTPKYAGARFAALKRILDREEPGYAS